MMTPSERQVVIRERLEKELAPSSLIIIDESYKHVGHEGAKTGASHFAIEVISKQFEGLSLIQRHQKIYAVLGDLIPQEIHALKIKVS